MKNNAEPKIEYLLWYSIQVSTHMRLKLWKNRLGNKRWRINWTYFNWKYRIENNGCDTMKNRYVKMYLPKSNVESRNPNFNWTESKWINIWHEKLNFYFLRHFKWGYTQRRQITNNSDMKNFFLCEVVTSQEPYEKDMIKANILDRLTFEAWIQPEYHTKKFRWHCCCACIENWYLFFFSFLSISRYESWVWSFLLLLAKYCLRLVFIFFFPFAERWVIFLFVYLTLFCDILFSIE